MVDTFYVASSHWQLDGQIAAALIARGKALGQDILIDYDHQTLKTDQNVQPAPALTPGRGAGASSLFVILGEVAAVELA
ncbi:phage protease [Aeromonas hydrophila]|uniref:phage protease n=1 Tax=Aeromonas hydrophila TaxID=644 RepID=UPI001F0062F4|nr:phage protease [Aeromonas hydrophila]